MWCVCVSQSQVQPLPQGGDWVNSVKLANRAMALHARTSVNGSSGQ